MSVASPSAIQLPAEAGALAQGSWRALPPRMRVLFITSLARTGGWLAEAFASDSASEVDLCEAIGITAGLARLRDEVFDAVLISHEAEGLDALDLLDALRTSSSERLPIVILGAQSEQELAAHCFEAGADAYVCVHTTTTRTLIWQVARAVERHQLLSENGRLQQAQRHRLQLEHEEANRLLYQQRALIDDLDRLAHAKADAVADRGDPTSAVACGWETTEPVRPILALPLTLVGHYRELLRAYVVMGSGNLNDEMLRLTDLFAAANVSARQAMLLHLNVLEELIQGLGNRSARHVMNRADLLVMEVMIHLAENYRERLWQRLHPPRQRWLPGCEPGEFGVF